MLKFLLGLSIALNIFLSIIVYLLLKNEKMKKFIYDHLDIEFWF